MFDRFKSLLHGVQKQLCASITRHETGITFAVDDVEPTKSPLWTSRLDDVFEFSADLAVYHMPEPSTQVFAPEGYTGKANLKHPFARTRLVHPLIEAVHLAFSGHRPLILSPDTIWMTIVQGFSQHVLKNAERLRGHIVMHEGVKELKVRTYLPIHWPVVIDEFSIAMKKNSDPILHETLLCEFSTTTSDMKTAYEVALMNAYQRYFKYVMECICGIPEITLEGTPDDWQRMRERIEVLATYDLGWWTRRVAPILDNFIATANGEPDLAFWQAIYKPREVYSSELATGWIADLFPYLHVIDEEVLQEKLLGGSQLDPDELTRLLESASYVWRRNHIFDTERINWLPTADAGVPLGSFPLGLSEAPVKIICEDDTTMDVKLLGGFLGIAQRPDNALSPMISWAVVEAESNNIRPTFSPD